MLLLPFFMLCVLVLWDCLVYRSPLATIPPPLPLPPIWVMHCAPYRAVCV